MLQNNKKVYEREEVLRETINYFKGDTLAADVWINKYCLKDSLGNLYEKTPDDTHQRISKEFARIEKKYVNAISEEEIYDLLRDFKYIIPQGSPMAGIGNDFQYASLSNCFVIGNEIDSDSYGGIIKLDQELVQLMKRRAGVGLDVSFIRPKGSPVQNSALTSTGVVPFMERFSNSTREVAQDGRRGALMQSISIKSIDSEAFIDAKMIKGKVTGANISVKITDEFMDCVLNDKMFIQQFPVDSDHPIITKEVNAKKLWEKIISNAWTSAEPGLLFWDNIINESLPDCYADLGFKTISTNPCITGDTKVMVADERNYVSIKQLTEEGKDVDVYCFDDEGKVAIRTMRNPRITGYDQKIYKIKFVSGGEVKVTENHKFRCYRSFNSLWIETKDLIKGDKVACVINLEELKFPTTKHIESVEFYGYENVYNGTVDDFHNYMIGEFVEQYEDVYNGNVEDYHNYSFWTPSEQNNYKLGKKCTTSVNCKNCGEIPLCANDSCRLLVLNLFSYVISPFTKEAKFDMVRFEKHTIIAQRLMDDLVDLEIEKIDRILSKIEMDPESKEIKRTEMNLWKNIRAKCIKGRRTGLGITGEGDMLAALGLRYATEEGNDFSENIHKKFKHFAYHSTNVMAKERGAFLIYDKEREKENPFLLRIKSENKELYDDLNMYGRRNIALLTIAPVGSISILTQTTSGIEPAFLIHYTRRKKINPNDPETRVDFVDEVGDSWQEYKVFHHKFEMYLEANGYDVNEVKNMSDDDINKIIEKSPYYKATSNDVDWVKRIEMQGRIQKHVDHSISVTVNLPNDISKEIVAKVYETGWKVGCKGVTIYRDGSGSGVLITKKEKQQQKLFKEVDAPTRPKILECSITRFMNGGEKWIGLIGVLENKPYELFTGKLENFPIPNYVETGTIVKTKIKDVGSSYDFVYKDKLGNDIKIPSLNHAFDKEYYDLAKTFSAILRHGMPLHYVISLIDGLKLDGDLINTWKSGVKRMLKRYVADGTKISNKKCPECGSESLQFIEGCLTCSNCGNSKCG